MVNDGISAGNRRKRPIATRRYPFMCGPEYQHFWEETSAMSGTEIVVAGSGLQNLPEGVGTSTGLKVQEKQALPFCDTAGNSQKAIVPVEACKNQLTIQADASEKLVNSGAWDKLLDAAAFAAMDLDTIDSGVDAQSHQVEEVAEEDQDDTITRSGLQILPAIKKIPRANSMAAGGKQSWRAGKPVARKTKPPLIGSIVIHRSSSSQLRGDAVDARSRVRRVLDAFQTVCRELLQRDEAEKIRRIDLEAAKILKSRGMEVNTVPHHFIGPVPGIEVGDEFQYRVELAIVGIHRALQGGIDFTTEDGEKIAVSVVASGGYDDDLGDPNVLVYSGQGGNPGRGKEPVDQKLERGNLALWNSQKVKNPVRVVRGSKGMDDEDNSKMVTSYVYDGLYTVADRWKEKGEHGNRVFMFRLTRNPGQPEVSEA